MKKFKVTVTQGTYRNGTYTIEAANLDDAFDLVWDTPFGDQRIVWDEWSPDPSNYPDITNTWIDEAE